MGIFRLSASKIERMLRESALNRHIKASTQAEGLRKLQRRDDGAIFDVFDRWAESGKPENIVGALKKLNTGEYRALMEKWCERSGYDPQMIRICLQFCKENAQKALGGGSIDQMLRDFKKPGNGSYRCILLPDDHNEAAIAILEKIASERNDGQVEEAASTWRIISDIQEIHESEARLRKAADEQLFVRYEKWDTVESRFLMGAGKGDSPMNEYSLRKGGSLGKIITDISIDGMVRRNHSHRIIDIAIERSQIIQRMCGMLYIEDAKIIVSSHTTVRLISESTSQVPYVGTLVHKNYRNEVTEEIGRRSAFDERERAADQLVEIGARAIKPLSDEVQRSRNRLLYGRAIRILERIASESPVSEKDAMDAIALLKGLGIDGLEDQPADTTTYTRVRSYETSETKKAY